MLDRSPVALVERYRCFQGHEWSKKPDGRVPRCPTLGCINTGRRISISPLRNPNFTTNLCFPQALHVSWSEIHGDDSPRDLEAKGFVSAKSVGLGSRISPSAQRPGKSVFKGE